MKTMYHTALERIILNGFINYLRALGESKHFTVPGSDPTEVEKIEASIWLVYGFEKVDQGNCPPPEILDVVAEEFFGVWKVKINTRHIPTVTIKPKRHQTSIEFTYNQLSERIDLEGEHNKTKMSFQQIVDVASRILVESELYTTQDVEDAPSF